MSSYLSDTTLYLTEDIYLNGINIFLKMFWLNMFILLLLEGFQTSLLIIYDRDEKPTALDRLLKAGVNDSQFKLPIL